MSEQMKNLIKKMGEDPTVVERFKNDPEAVMEEHGLSEEHKKLIRNKDKKGIQQATDLGDAHMNFIVL